MKARPDYKHGRQLYETCAVCHQAEGRGMAERGVPNIAGQHFQVIVKQLADFRDNERLDSRMEAFVSRHHLAGPQDLADVAAFIAKMQPQAAGDLGTERLVGAGKAAYTRTCAQCHGEAAEGSNHLRYPRLAGQHYTYLVKQIDTMIGGSRFNVSWEHARMLEGLTDDEIMGVAAYLARLGPQRPTRPDK